MQECGMAEVKSELKSHALFVDFNLPWTNQSRYLGKRTFATHCLTTYVSCPRLHDAFSHGRRIYSGSNPCQNSKSTPRNPDVPVELLKITFDLVIPTDRAPPATFWVPYNDDERNTGLRVCLLVWLQLILSWFLGISNWRLQLQSCLGGTRDWCWYELWEDALHDNFLSTESRKSLRNIFSLERLQAVQVLEFECYGIKTLVINEDTPNDPDLWKVRPRKVQLGIV